MSTDEHANAEVVLVVQLKDEGMENGDIIGPVRVLDVRGTPPVVLDRSDGWLKLSQARVLAASLAGHHNLLTEQVRVEVT